MQFFKYFAGGVLFTFSILAVIAWGILPGDFEIVESIEIEAKKSDVFQVMNNLQTWERWLFDGDDSSKPSIEFISAQREGIDASMLWKYVEGSDVKVTIIESVPIERLQISFTTLANEETTQIKILIEQVQDKVKLQWMHTGSYGWGIATRFSASILDFEGKTAELYAQQLKRLKAYIENSSL